MDSLTRLPLALVLVLLLLAAAAHAAPNVTVELLEIDPAKAREMPLHAQVHGRIRYATDAPVRLVLVPYRNGQPVEEGVYFSGSPDYPAGSGEAHAWFAFSSPQSIDEIRAVANDVFGNEFATASTRKTIAWRAGATRTKLSAWVAPLQKSADDLSQSQQLTQENSGMLVLVLMQLVFACIPLSVAVQIFSLCKLEGSLKSLARFSACAMAALWIFVLATGIAGSNLSPIWLVLLSPLFLLFLAVLLVVRSKFQRTHYSVEEPLKQV
jgi:hypothetical protein